MGRKRYTAEFKREAVRQASQPGVTFRLHDGAVRKEQVVEFLKAHYRRRLLVIWDGAKPHRSRLVGEYVDPTDGQIVVALLPAYAPELNPVEYLWAWLKRHALANFCPDTLTELQNGARSKLKSAQRRSTIIAACWFQASLF